ncbi:hypothetical protein QYF36_019805 [Acer negundo]|nr:hypothetical protein QYF36_019805 [Acer negundo]
MQSSSLLLVQLFGPWSIVKMMTSEDLLKDKLSLFSGENKLDARMFWKKKIVSSLGRLVIIIWLFVVFVINSSYTASLTSILTVQQLSSPIKGIGGLKSNNDPIDITKILVIGKLTCIGSASSESIMFRKMTLVYVEGMVPLMMIFTCLLCSSSKASLFVLTCGRNSFRSLSLALFIGHGQRRQLRWKFFGQVIWLWISFRWG